MGGVKDENGATVFVIHGNCPLHGFEEAVQRPPTVTERADRSEA